MGSVKIRKSAPRWGVVLLAFSSLACEPAPPPAPVGMEGCLLFACHGAVEAIHYGGAPLACVDCHGGDPDALTKEAAHPTVTVSFNPATPGVKDPDGRLLRGASLRELDELDPEILKFLNPSDYRVVMDTCGSAALGAGNCHTRISSSSVLSTHATLAGQLAGGLYFGGLTDKAALYGIMDVADPFPVDTYGTVGELERFTTDVNVMPHGTDVERGYFASFSAMCIECHLGADGRVVPGKYTSSGCNACHLLTEDDSRPRTTDPTMDVDELGHGGKHRLTNLITDDQCNRCHHAHLHRGLLSKGIRERSEPEGDLAIGGINPGIEDSEHVTWWPEENYVRFLGGYYLYGKPYPFYIEDEDDRNDFDETPPDIHFEKGMACIDCHTMAELHGGDHMPVRRAFETKVRCETCHGTPEEAITVLGLPFVKALSRVGGTADNAPMIEELGKYDLVEEGKLDGALHPVTQIAERVDPGEARFNPRTLMGCGLHAGDADFRATLLTWFESTPARDVAEVFPGMPEMSSLPSDLGDRPGRMECFACHNAWTVNCFGCHIVRDDTVMARNAVTGEMEPGGISTFAMSVLPDALALGFNARGRISPMVGTSIFFSHIDSSGNTIVDAAPLTTADGLSGDGNQHNPVHHHTVRRRPRDCDGCHPTTDEAGLMDNEEMLKRVTGFGTGEFLFIDGTGKAHILDRLVAIDFDGDGLFDDPVSTSLGTFVYETAPIAASTHMPLTDDPGAIEPGPLDAETINRLLGNPVVPQRAR